MDWLARIFDTSGFPPRWQCGSWSAGHGWTHIISDVAIFAAYLAIPIVLAFFLVRRRDVPFLPVFWLFAVFILSCGITHLIEATIFWNPWYRLSAVFKVITAVASLATVVALIPIMPRALTLPGLAAVNEKLTREVEKRREAEDKLQRHMHELEASNHDLEAFTQAILGREERVLELKQEVNELLSALQREPRYQLAPEAASEPSEG